MNALEELTTLEDLIDQIIEVLKNTIESGEILSDEFQGLLAEELTITVDRIDQLKEQISKTSPVNETPIESPIPPGTDLLWILSGNNPGVFTNYLQTYPGEGFKDLANNPNQLAQVIQRLEKISPEEESQTPSDGIPNTELPSSNVSGMKYDPKTGKLLVKYHGEDQEPVYQYDSVPPQVFYLLEHGNAFAQTKGKNKWGEWWPMKNPSIGASVNQYLKKGGYSYRKVS